MKKTLLILALLLLSTQIINGQSARKRRLTLNYDWSPGLVNILDVGYGVRSGATSTDLRQYFSITNITAYQFDYNHIKTGIGYGVQMYDDDLFIPLFVNTRFNITSDFWLPFISASGGVAISPDDISSQSRVFFNPEIGVRHLALAKLSLNMSSGVMIQSGGPRGRETFFTIKLGVEFKGPRFSFL